MSTQYVVGDWRSGGGRDAFLPWVEEYETLADLPGDTDPELYPVGFTLAQLAMLEWFTASLGIVLHASGSDGGNSVEVDHSETVTNGYWNYPTDPLPQVLTRQTMNLRAGLRQQVITQQVFYNSAPETAPGIQAELELMIGPMSTLPWLPNIGPNTVGAGDVPRHLVPVTASLIGGGTTYRGPRVIHLTDDDLYYPAISIFLVSRLQLYAGGDPPVPGNQLWWSSIPDPAYGVAWDGPGATLSLTLGDPPLPPVTIPLFTTHSFGAGSGTVDTPTLVVNANTW